MFYNFVLFGLCMTIPASITFGRCVIRGETGEWPDLSPWSLFGSPDINNHVFDLLMHLPLEFWVILVGVAFLPFLRNHA